MELIDRLKSTSSIFEGKKIIDAFSGGKDSTLVLLLALKYAKMLKPVYFAGPIFSEHEQELTKEICNALNIELKVITMNPLGKEEFKKNPENRCYICKSMIMTNLQQYRKELNYDAIAEGTNKSELKGHRPGFQALQELNILSPLLQINLTKDEIKQGIILISQNLEEWFEECIDRKRLNKLLVFISKSPSNPCLCSRIEYFLPITTDRLKMVLNAEEWLKKEFNLKTLRVRLHSNAIARIEVNQDKIHLLTKTENANKIVNYLKKLGFKYSTIDLKGFRSGSMIEK